MIYNTTVYEQDSVGLDEFEAVDTKKNRRLVNAHKQDDRILAYRTKGKYWGKERTVVVTYNPVTASKQSCTFDSKLEEIRQQLIAMRSRVRDRAPHWRDQETIKERYLRLCEKLHVPKDLYVVEVVQMLGKPTSLLIPPMVNTTSGEAIGNTYQTPRSSAYSGFKTFNKFLRISFDDNDFVSDIDYTSSGNK